MEDETCRHIFSGNLLEGSGFGVEVSWPGGAGKFVVSGTFSGASAQISLSATALGGNVTGSAYDIGIGPLTAPGTYAFVGAKGKLNISVPAPDPAESISSLQIFLIR